MKLLCILPSSILWAVQTLAMPADPEGIESFAPVPDANALFKRAPQHCGTFKFKCKSSAGACNNACYYINCVNKGRADFTYGTSAVDNRVHSGCWTTNKEATLCRTKPFVQRFWDRQDDDVAPKPLSCDEFPMNAFRQGPYQQGTIRNSLRCINAKENSSGGSQFLQFRDAKGDWAKGGKLAGSRDCEGKMKDGDTFKVDWIIDGDDGISNADQDKRVPYCKPNPKCDNDGHQFHMSKLQVNDKGVGNLSNPYNYENDNHYALTGKSDIKEYRATIERKEDWASIDVFEVAGSKRIDKGTASGAFGDGKQLKVELEKLSHILRVYGSGGIGTKVTFIYAKSDADTLSDLSFSDGDIGWTTDDKSQKGRWCVSEQWGGKDGDSRMEIIQCSFPGLA
ncbi:unnamed protein product [Periconia digitata]|uniref:Deoxyribonuclease NucA/NucB domain-containing protein n=1 Tax=Periconia digitata TaxID=1303443 RepID=A0A9W4U7K9_9PLEO|nr:unnamed protein product [Periconia digitata]